MNMETKKKTCPKCGQEDGSGQNKIHDMNPKHFVKCDIRSIMERDGVCYHCAFWIRMYEQHKNDPNWLIIDGTSYIANPFVPNTNNKTRRFMGFGGRTRTVVNARDLHEFLESRKDFSSWIKDRIERYDLTENEDYVVFTEFGENSKGGRPKKEYALTLDAAKELSMVEGNEKGKQARKYFIACEKKLKGENPSYLIADPIKRAEKWIQEEKKGSL